MFIYLRAIGSLQTIKSLITYCNVHKKECRQFGNENCNCGYCFNEFLFNLGLSLANINCVIEKKLEDFHRMVLSSQFC